ncbi:hypothetical protein DA075_10410 [Methylobacterium currus]|jgi:hypothetical protein|uniref:Ribosomal protein S27 n=1 Tax=Methylobacterium currus TaxID=2051553 RepID=A0A2R4WI99_9HYPH|nr:hypothetical protein [Methylobacterium currus]AWB21272.1 hypothetical protein DA075_10410 [Methylobacterium currus]UHC13978.1 hypothetical protein LRS73_15430 [Methylobacterium currus]
MADFLTVALVCASTLAAPDCSRETALDVAVAPAPTPITCLMQGETLAAQSGFVRGQETYLKVACERRRTAALRPEAEAR